MRALTRYFCFESWDLLLSFMIEQLDNLGLESDLGLMLKSPNKIESSSKGYAFRIAA